jgi:chromosome partitioning protein
MSQQQCRVVTLSALKGGVGKSSICAGLSAQVASMSKKARVLIIDADSQGSLEDWSKLRRHNYPDNCQIDVVACSDKDDLIATVRDAVKSYTAIFIDSPPRDSEIFRVATALPAFFGGVTLVPIVPSPGDWWSFIKLTKILQEIRVKAPQLELRAVLNMCPANSRQLRTLSDNMTKVAPLIPTLHSRLGQRTAIRTAFEAGQGVCELATSRSTEVAQYEFSALYRELEKQFVN